VIWGIVAHSYHLSCITIIFWKLSFCTPKKWLFWGEWKHFRKIFNVCHDLWSWKPAFNTFKWLLRCLLLIWNIVAYSDGLNYITIIFCKLSLLNPKTHHFAANKKCSKNFQCWICLRKLAFTALNDFLDIYYSFKSSGRTHGLYSMTIIFWKLSCLHQKSDYLRKIKKFSKTFQCAMRSWKPALNTCKWLFRCLLLIWNIRAYSDGLNYITIIFCKLSLLTPKSHHFAEVKTFSKNFQCWICVRTLAFNSVKQHFDVYSSFKSSGRTRMVSTAWQ